MKSSKSIIPAQQIKIRSFFCATLTVAAMTFWITGCGDGLLGSSGSHNKENKKPEGKTNFGLVKVTISGIGTKQMKASARSMSSNFGIKMVAAGASGITEPSNTDGSGDRTIEIKSFSNGSFTYGSRNGNGVRYILATFKVRNAQSDSTAYDAPLKI